MLPKTREAATWAEASARWRSRNLWRRSGTGTNRHPRRTKGRILDEFTAITGHHRKHGIGLLGGTADNKGKQALGRRIYDEAVREAVIVVWEASDRICGKRLKAALSNFVDSMERHGHLSLDPAVRERLLSASAVQRQLLLPVPSIILAGSPPCFRLRCWATPVR